MDAFRQLCLLASHTTPPVLGLLAILEVYIPYDVDSFSVIPPRKNFILIHFTPNADAFEASFILMTPFLSVFFTGIQLAFILYFSIIFVSGVVRDTRCLFHPFPVYSLTKSYFLQSPLAFLSALVENSVVSLPHFPQ